MTNLTIITITYEIWLRNVGIDLILKISLAK